MTVGVLTVPSVLESFEKDEVNAAVFPSLSVVMNPLEARLQKCENM